MAEEAAMDDAYVFTEADAAAAQPEEMPSGRTEIVQDNRGEIVPQHTLWVGNIPPNINSEQISAVLSQGHGHGTILRVEVSLRRLLGSGAQEKLCDCVQLFRREAKPPSPTFALATCITPAAAHMVKCFSDGCEVALRGTGADPLRLKVLWAMQYPTLRIDCVPLQLKENEFTEIFKQFGDVQSACLGKHCVTGKPQGHGYVTFGRRFSAAVTLDILQENLFCLPGSHQPVAASMFRWPEVTSVVFDSSFGGVSAPSHLSQPGCLEWEYNVQWRELLHRQRSRLRALQRTHLLQNTALRAAQQSLYFSRASRAKAVLLRGEDAPPDQHEARADAVLPKAPPACAVPCAQAILEAYAPVPVGSGPPEHPPGQ